jgi:hypothetical protein
VHAFVALHRTHRPWYIADVEVRGTSARTDSIRVPLMRTDYVQYVSTGGSNALLVAAGLDSAATHEHPDAVYVVRRGPAGWGRAVRVVRGVGNLNHLALVRGTADTVHLFWGSAERGIGWSDQLNHAWSADGGKTWTATGAYRLPTDLGLVSYFRAASDRCGRIHVVVFYFGAPARAMALDWAGRWRQAAPLPGRGGGWFLAGDMKTAPDGTIDLVWPRFQSADSTEQLLYARYRCEPRARLIRARCRCAEGPHCLRPEKRARCLGRRGLDRARRLTGAASTSAAIDLALDRLIRSERLRRDITAYTGTPPTEAEVALAAITPSWSDLADETHWDALYGEEG